MEFHSNHCSRENIATRQCYLVIENSHPSLNDDHFLVSRAVRNLHQLVLRQQKVEQEGEQAEEIEDPIKRVRQQLDKVNSFDC